jgi:hypothetical protein
MSLGSSNDNRRESSGDRSCGGERASNGLRFVDLSLIDALLQEATELAQEAHSLIQRSCTEDRNSRRDILETLLTNRDAFLTTTRLSLSVAWLLAAKEVQSKRLPGRYLSNFDLAAVRSLADDPYLVPEPSGESVVWAPLLRRSNDVFRWVIDLNNLVVKSMTI